MMQKNPSAIVLAAGLGTRLRPVTDLLPKPLVPVCGTPLLSMILGKLAEAGTEKIALNTHYMPEKIEEFISASAYSGCVELFHEPEILGTGGPLVNAKRLLAEKEFFFLHNCDILSGIDLTKLAEFHLKNGFFVTMVLNEGPENKVSVSDGKVVDILGRLGYKKTGVAKYTYTGIMALSPEIFKYLPEKPCNASIITAVLDLMKLNPGRVGAFIDTEAYWNDLGTIKQYFKAHEDIVYGKSLGGVAGSVSFGRGCDVSPGTSIEGFVFAGDNCSTGAGTFLRDCIILDNTSIPDGAFHFREIVGPDFSRHRDWEMFERMPVLKKFEGEFSISSLAEQGSDRKFYRVSNRGSDSVLMVSGPEDQDFDRFINIGPFLYKNGAYTPEIYYADTEDFTVLMEDLGNDTLYRAVKGNISHEEFENLYRDVLNSLAGFQLAAFREVFAGRSPGIRDFKLEYLRWETDYFHKNFLAAYCGLHPSAAIEKEFDALAEYVYSQPKVFMHRDFQSQNILIKDSSPRFVDFQGARIGPWGYDVISLLRDPYLDIPSGSREKLLRYYFDEFIDKSAGDFPEFEKCSYDDFKAFAVTAGLQRNMQALGAYGFLSLKKGKTQYLDYIPKGLKYLLEGLEDFKSVKFPFKLDALISVCREASAFIAGAGAEVRKKEVLN